MTETSTKYKATQLTIPSIAGSNAEANRSPSALTNHAEAQLDKILDFLTKRTKEGNGSISTYKASASTGSKNRYFRYTYREKGKQKSKSIPGGNIRSPLAQKRATVVKQMILGGKSISEIVYYIGGFTTKR